MSYVSPAIERVLGYRPEERVGASAFELLHPEDLTKVEGLLLECWRTPGSPVSAEVRMRHKDGLWRHVEATVTNRLDDPSVEAVVVNWRDLTKSKETEEALRESERRYATLLANEPGAPAFQTEICHLLQRRRGKARRGARPSRLWR